MKILARRRGPVGSLLLLCALGGACSDTELVGIHVRLEKNGSGVVTTRALMQSLAMSPIESRTQGVNWEARANLCASQGRFQSLGEVKFGEGEIRFMLANGDMPGLRAIIQCGPEAKWVQGLVPGLDQRRAMAKVYDPTGKTAEVGEAIRIEVTVPGEVVSAGVMPKGRGVDEAKERNRAYVLIPVKTALEKNAELVWDISWK